MRIRWLSELPAISIILTMYVAAAISWSSVSDRLPVHWDLSGEVNRYGGKLEGLLLVPLIATFVYFTTLVTSGGDQPSIVAIRLAVAIFMAGIHAGMLLSYHGRTLNMTTFTFSAVAVLLLVIVAAAYLRSPTAAHP